MASWSKYYPTHVCFALQIQIFFSVSHVLLCLSNALLRTQHVILYVKWTCHPHLHVNARLNLRYFVCMADYPHLLKHLITSETLTVFKKSHMKAQCVIFCGPTQMIAVVGVYLHVVLDTLLAKYYFYPMVYNLSFFYTCCDKLYISFSGYIWAI